MKRFATLVVGMCLLVGVVPGIAKKKSAKPIAETFEATLAGHGVLRFEVEEFSTDQDVEELAQAYAKGGKDAVEHSLESSEKGTYRYQLFRVIQSPTTIYEAYSIRFIQSTSQSGTRILNIIADAADSAAVNDIRGGPAYMARIGHRGYPFSIIRLRIDQKGKGTGEQIPFAAIFFNKQGVMDVNPMPTRFDFGNAMVQLTDVHAMTR